MGSKKVPAIYTLVIAIFVILAFQNCGDITSKHSINSENSIETEQSNDPDSQFKAGDPFDPEKIPYPLNDAGFEARLLDYPSAEGFKAVAIAKNGIGTAEWISKDNLVKTQEEWNRVILERCELQAREPCALFAEGNEIKYDKSQFLKMDDSHIEIPNQMDGLKIPGLIDHWREFVEETYLPIKKGEYKAYAIGVHGNTSAGWSQNSQEEAIRRAFEFCELISSVHTCTLYAIGNEVFFNTETYQFEEPRILFGPGKLNADFIPLINDNARAAVKKAVARVESDGSHMVLAIERFGNYHIIESNKSITKNDRKEAVRLCSEKIAEAPPGEFQRSCMVYSIDLDIVWTREDYLEASNPP